MFGVFWRFRRSLHRYRAPLVIGSFLVILVAAADIAAPWPLKIVVDNVLRGEPLRSEFASLLSPSARTDPRTILLVAVIGLLFVVGIGAMADYLGTYVLNGIGERLTADLRGSVFSHLQGLSLSYHDRQRVGDLTTRVTADVDYVQEMLIASLSILAPNLVVLVGIIAVMFLADPEFTFVALAVAPLLFLTVFSYTRRIKRASKVARRKEGEIASIASETLSSIRVVQAFTGERRHERRFRDQNLERMAAGLEVVGLQAKFSPVVDMLAAVGMALVLWLGAIRVLDGEMSLGLLLVFVSYLSQLYKPMRNLSKLATVVSRGQASADRVLELLSVDARVVEKPGAREAGRLGGSVEVRAVTFGYESGQPVLHEASLIARPGERVALVGPTGAGKSTLAGLIPRFYDPWEGEVLVDGRDVREYTVKSLRRNVALVLQDSILFHGTIFENIAYGTKHATPEQVLEAAQAAYVDEFVSRLPEGYETRISERGSTLSGGQRQRIAIARALVRDAPIVILDEPTSNLDATSEGYVMKGLERLVRGRTVLIIAHRMSTLKDADRVYVLQAGRVVHSGSHDDVQAQSSLYRELAAAPAAMLE